MDHCTMLLKLKDDSIKNEELSECLSSKDFSITGLAIYKIIERKYCDELIMETLANIAKLLKGYKVVGVYQIGHLAISTLFLIGTELSTKKYEEIYRELNDKDKFLVDNFIKGMQNKNNM